MYKELLWFSRDQVSKPQSLGLNLWLHTSVADRTSLIIYTVLLSFPALIPHSLTNIFWHHILNKVPALKFLSKISLGESKLKHLSALFFLFPFISLISVLVQKTPCKEWLPCDTLRTPPLFLESQHMYDQFFLQDWYFLWPLSSSHGFYLG